LTLPHAEPELRNHETIRAYLEALVQQKAPVQLWVTRPGSLPFSTTLEKVETEVFTTTTSPQMEPGEALEMAFMLEFRRFTFLTKVLAPGLFQFPPTLRNGERRALPRAPFKPGDRAGILALEFLKETFPGGRIIQGKLLDLSTAGLRLSLDEFDILTGPAEALRPGDTFEWMQITNLQNAPDLQVRATLVHLTGRTAGLSLEGLSEGGQDNLRRTLAPRFPATFGQGFPALKRRIDLGDRAGIPTPKRVAPKAPEVVEFTLVLPPPEAQAPLRPSQGAGMRIRKLARQILMLSAQSSLHALAEAFRQDGFRHVFEARTLREAQIVANTHPINLLLIDNSMGGHWARDLLKALQAHDLFRDTPIILIVECRNEFSLAIAEDLGAMHIHERRESYEDLWPVLRQVLLEDAPEA
jgi:CheY-like chemotaxis protein